MASEKKSGWKRWIMASFLAVSITTTGSMLLPDSWVAVPPDPEAVPEDVISSPPVVDQNTISTTWSGKLNYLSSQFNEEIWPGVANETHWVYDIVTQNNMTALQQYLNSGGNLHSDSDAIMRMAANTGSLDIVKFAVENGADVTALHNQAIRLASVQGHQEIVNYLIEKGADKDAASNPTVYKTFRPGSSTP